MALDRASRSDVFFQGVDNHKIAGIPFHAARHRGGIITPTIVILHDTAGRLDPGNSARYLRDNDAKVSVHFVIERDRSIEQQVETNRRANHAGASSFHGRSGRNDFSIGFEIVNPGQMGTVPGLPDHGRAWWGEVISGAVAARTPQHGSGLWLPYTMGQGVPGTIRIEGDKLFIDYEPTGRGSGYVSPSVMLEFGARSTGEPASPREVACDAAGFVEGVSFPAARPRVMHAARTFWEKATAAHVFCLQARLRGERFARHWYDLAKLDEAGLADAALADRDLAQAVAAHKQMFFSEKAADRSMIDYSAAVAGQLRLVPEGDALAALGDDCRRMTGDRLLLADAPPFEAVIERCGEIQARANQR